jgi:hypothetical protein
MRGNQPLLAPKTRKPGAKAGLRVENGVSGGLRISSEQTSCAIPAPMFLRSGALAFARDHVVVDEFERAEECEAGDD